MYSSGGGDTPFSRECNDEITGDSDDPDIDRWQVRGDDITLLRGSTGDTILARRQATMRFFPASPAIDTIYGKCRQRLARLMAVPESRLLAMARQRCGHWPVDGIRARSTAYPATMSLTADAGNRHDHASAPRIDDFSQICGRPRFSQADFVEIPERIRYVSYFRNSLLNEGTQIGNRCLEWHVWLLAWTCVDR